MQEENGSSVYIRLSTRNITQLQRTLNTSLENEILSGGYWLEKSEKPSDIIIVFFWCNGTRGIRSCRNYKGR